MLSLLFRLVHLSVALCFAMTLVLAVGFATASDPPELVQAQADIFGFGDFTCFGWDADMQADVAVAVAPYAPRTSIYERSGSSWTEVAGFFDGLSVATDGVRVLVQGSFSHSLDVDVWVDAGAGWGVEQRLTAGPNGFPILSKDLDVFGERIAVTGTDEVEVWELQAGTWSLATSLAGADTQSGDEFGRALSLWDRVLAVGAPGAGAGVGAVYVFLETSGQWTEVAKLVPTDGAAGWGFGAGVSVYAGRLAVGAPGYAFAPDEHGAVYTYRQAGPSWNPTGTLVFRYPGAFVYPIGHMLDLDDEWLIAGHQSTFGFASAPRAPLWHRTGEVWTEIARLDSTLFGSGADQWAGGVGLQPGWAMQGTPGYLGVGVVQFYPTEPPPLVFCTGKLNSDGCVGRIASCGLPSVTQSITFDVTAQDVLGAKPGLLIYGYGPDAIPFLGGTLCIQPPVRRTPTVLSSGDATPCSGGFTFDFDARIKSGIDPLLFAGASAVAQYWHRDPADPFGAGLTDALAFTVWP